MLSLLCAVRHLFQAVRGEPANATFDLAFPEAAFPDAEHWQGEQDTNVSARPCRPAPSTLDTRLSLIPAPGTGNARPKAVLTPNVPGRGKGVQVMSKPWCSCIPAFRIQWDRQGALGQKGQVL